MRFLLFWSPRLSEMPRHCRLDLNTPAELAIRKAIHEVELAGCAPDLTDVVVDLDRCRAKLAAYIDASPLSQVFGYTPPGPTGAEAFVPYLMAFREKGGANYEFVVRNSDGGENRVRLPASEARALAKALLDV